MFIEAIQRSNSVAIIKSLNIRAGIINIIIDNKNKSKYEKYVLPYDS